MSTSIELVIARYREDITWVPTVSLPAVVYDKGGEGTGIALPNVGRESHTYLHHILARWPEFPDYTVFLQGDPFRHMAPGSGPRELAETIRALVGRGVRFKGLADYSIRCDALGRPHDFLSPQNAGRWPGAGRDIPVGELYARLFAGPVPTAFHTRAPAGLLLVSRERILLRPKALYEAAMAAVLADPRDEQNTGHAMERLWYLIFNGYAALNRESSS